MKARQYKFKAEFTSSLGQYGSRTFLVPNYAEAYARAWSIIEGNPRWHIIAVAPISERVEPPLGATYNAVMRVLKEKGAFKYRERYG